MQVSVRSPFPLGDVDDDGVFDAADMAVVDAVYLGAPLPPGVPLARLTPEPTLTLTWVNYLHDVLATLQPQRYGVAPLPVSPDSPTAWFSGPAPGTYDAYLWCEQASLVLLHGGVTPTRVALYASDFSTLLEEHVGDFVAPSVLDLYDDRSTPDWHCQLAAPAGWSLLRITAASVTDVTVQHVGPFVLAAAVGVNLAVSETQAWLLPPTSDFTLDLPPFAAEYQLSAQLGYRGAQAFSFGTGAVLPDLTLPPQISWPRVVEDRTLQPTVRDYTSPLAGMGTPAPATAPPADADAFVPRTANTWWTSDTNPIVREFRVIDAFTMPHQATLTTGTFDALLVCGEYLHDPYSGLAALENVIWPEWQRWVQARGVDERLELYLFNLSGSELFATVDLSQVWRGVTRLALNTAWLSSRPLELQASLLIALLPWGSLLSRWVEAQLDPTYLAPPHDLARVCAYLYPLDGEPPLLDYELRVAKHTLFYPWLAHFTRTFDQWALALESYGTFLQALFAETLPDVLLQPTITAEMATRRLQTLSNAVLPSLVTMLFRCSAWWGYAPITNPLDDPVLQRYTLPLDVAGLCTTVTAQFTAQLGQEWLRRNHGGSTAWAAPLTELYAPQSLPSTDGLDAWLRMAEEQRTLSELRSLFTQLIGLPSPAYSLQRALGGYLLAGLSSAAEEAATRFDSWHADPEFVTNYVQAYERLTKAIYYVSTPDHGLSLLMQLQQWPDVANDPSALPYARVELAGTATLTTLTVAYSAYAPHPQPGVPEHALPAGALVLFSRTQDGSGPTALRLQADQAVLLTVTRTR
jgi:hypothetical protein